MAIEKDIAIHHTKGIEYTISYTSDKEKSTYYQKPINDDPSMMIEQLIMEGSGQDIVNALNYAENLEKTLFSLDGDPNLLVTGVECSKDSASAEFLIVRRKYYETAPDHLNRVTGTKTDKKTGETVKKESIEAYHVIQSFPEVEELDPRLVHQIGIEYAQAAFPGHQCVVSTHMNTAHLHNHIIVNAYSKEHIGRKYRMNMDRRREIRRINDELSLKYNLPILMDNDLQHNKGVSWKEWKSRQYGNSWKEKLKNDIRTASSMAGSWEEFKALMLKSGYKIRETKNTVTYTMPDSDTRKCRDSRLGEEFTRNHLLSIWLQKSTQTEEKTVQGPSRIHYELAKKPTSVYHLHVDRYTASGRRRTELEMLILTAIKIIQYFKNRFLDLLRNDSTKDVTNFPYAKKVDLMYKALEMLKKCNVSTKSELKDRMNDVGTKLSHDRKEIRNLEPILEFEGEMCEKIKVAQKLEANLRDKNILPDRLFIQAFSEREIAHNIAVLQPMTSSIRRELYQKVNKKKLFLHYKYEDISLTEAKAVIDYADGRSEVMPSCLLTPSEARDIALERQQEPSGQPQTDTDPDSSARNSEQDRKFNLLTYHYSEEEKELLFSYRNILNDLASYGIIPEQLSEYLDQHEAKKQNHIALQKEMIDLKNEYKDLCLLKGYIDLAENDRFTRGPLFTREPAIAKTSETTIEKEPVTETSPPSTPDKPFTDDTLSH